MSLIKFPTHITPMRLTAELLRVDEIFNSPLTNIQQVVSRGNPAWKWTLEYKNLSLDERDIVQAFLMNCKGSVNTFKIRDPGEYALSGAVSNWLDIYSGYGSPFTTTNTWDVTAGNSFYLSDDGAMNLVMTDPYSVESQWGNAFGGYHHGGNFGHVGSLDEGAMYAMRLKRFNWEDHVTFPLAFLVDKGSIRHLCSPRITSDCVATYPVAWLEMGAAPFSAEVLLGKTWMSGNQIGDTVSIADYELKRCAMVCNSENYLIHSEEYDVTPTWSVTNLTPNSGWDVNPTTGVDSGAWALFVNSSNAEHILQQAFGITVTSGDIWTLSGKFKKGAGLDIVQLELVVGVTTEVTALFHLTSGSVYAPAGDSGWDRYISRIWAVGSDWYRCQVTGHCTNISSAYAARVKPVNSTETTTFAASTSDYILMSGIQMRHGPFMGHYCKTVTDTIVGSSNLQTGSKLILDGFDSHDEIRAGQRFEVITQMHNEPGNVYEKSEFKRVTRMARASIDGHAVIHFDPPLRNSPAPTYVSGNVTTFEEHTLQPFVLFHKPEMKARLLPGTIRYTDGPLQMTDVTFEIIEDLTE